MTWVIITPEDTCAWNLKEAPLEEAPNLDDMQMYVEGEAETIPSSWLMKGVKTMIVNEEGKIYKLAPNQLATQLLDNPVPIVGNALIEWDEKMNNKEWWLE